ncbi:MAG: hypothetical protein OXC01_01715 [Immundisolibacterales bacterium]|nr:hypothetical protein [Immundisolibacterales bacterium]
MNEAVLQGFNRVLRLQLAAVQQHFIHVLMLRAWNEEAAAARRAAISQRVPALAATCARIESHYEELVRRPPGQKLPPLDNPCVDFGRVLREIAWSGSACSASSG